MYHVQRIAMRVSLFVWSCHAFLSSSSRSVRSSSSLLASLTLHDHNNSNNNKNNERGSSGGCDRVRELLQQRYYQQALEYTTKNIPHRNTPNHDVPTNMNRNNHNNNSNNDNDWKTISNLNAIVTEIFHHHKNNNNTRGNNTNNKNNHNKRNSALVGDDISIGIKALNLLLEQKSASPNIVVLALHVLCKPPNRGKYRRGYEFGVVVDKKYVPNYQIAYQLLLILLSGKGLTKNYRSRMSSKLGIAKDREFHAVLNACVSAGRMDMARKVMAIQRRTLGKKHNSPDAVTYSIMFKGYGRVGDSAAVDKLMRSVAANEIIPDIVMLNSAIDAYVRCGRIDQARSLLQSMIDGTNEGAVVCKPNARSYNTVLKGLAAEGNVDEAMKLALDMVALKLHDSVTANTLVNAAINAGRFNLAEKLLSSSDLGFGERLDDIKGHVEAYTALLDAYAKTGQLQKALGVLQTMTERNVKPNEITFTCAINALALAGRTTQAEKMIIYMETQVGIDASIITYNAFLTGLLSPDHESTGISLDERVKHATKYISESNMRPNTVTINLILDALGRCSPPRMVEARALLSAAEEKGLVPLRSERLYTTLIKGYALEKNLIGAKEAFMSMRKRDVVALNAYIDACSQCGDIKAGFQVFKEHVDGNEESTMGTSELVSPDVVTFSTLIQGLAQLDSKLAATKIQDLYKDMTSRWNIKPDVILVDA